MTKLTAKQQVVLDYIKHYLAKHHHAPFIREIQTDCWIASYKSTVDRLNALERKGYIKRTPNKHRGIQLRKSGKPPELVVAGELAHPEAADPTMAASS